MAASSPSRFEQQAAAIFFLSSSCFQDLRSLSYVIQLYSGPAISLLSQSVVFRTCDGCGKSYNSSYIRTHQRKHCSALKKPSTEAPTSFPSEEGNLSFAGTSDRPILDDFDDFSPMAGPSQPSGSWPSPHSGMDKPKYSYGASSLGLGMDISGGPTVQNMLKAFAGQCEEPCIEALFLRCDILGG